MNIYINGRFLTQEITGVQRYALEVTKAIDILISPNDVVVILTPKSQTIELNLKRISIKQVGFLTGHLWEQIELPLYCRNGLLFNPCATGPLFKTNQVSTFHDVNFINFPEGFTWQFRLWYKIIFFICGKLSKSIIAISNYTKNEVIEKFGIQSSKITVIYEGHQHFDEIEENKEILNKIDNSKPFILGVSSLNKNKNFDIILSCLKHINNVHFVIVGKPNPKIFGNAVSFKNRNVTFLGRVSDSELKSLYKNAFCFIYPSFFEGFGLPPLEAMSCGCACIISNTSCLPEIYQDSVLYCDPQSPESLSEQISLLLNDPFTTLKLHSKSKHILEKYSWIECSKKILHLLKNT
ncbi:glycosyltransferase family 1 protein [Runella rosea]|uniref:Glycosyltransferase family 1 protein n=1 Tax=Runella rosea TaxID=2259595 RepID=A0A344TCP7_9BACT|nr:glycosyltransferase family 1 protein [Runella rosea]AXE16418.1 glycosyltransferase family 1 protein [Runella rosea]